MGGEYVSTSTRFEFLGFVPRTKLIEIEQVEQTAEAEEQESTSSDDIPRPLTGESRQRALKEALADSCVKIYKSVRGMSHRFYNELRRHYYVTPSSYLKLMKLYSILYVEKLNEILENRYVIEAISQKTLRLHI